MAQISSALTPPSGEEVVIPPTSPISLNSPFTDYRIEEPTAYPNRLNGKLYLTDELGTNFTCSASVVVSPGKSLLFTAGHCAYDEGQWDHNFLFKPAYSSGVSPYGEWVAAKSRVVNGWVQSEGEDFAYDVAVLTLYPNNEGTRIQSALGGAWGVVFNGNANQYHQVIGYPGQPKPPYNGQEMIACDTSFVGWESQYTTATNGSFAVAPCNQGNGSSGGPFVTEKGAVQAVVSHSLCEIGEPSNCHERLYGTYFGAAAENLYTAAENEAPTLPVPPAAAPAPAPTPTPIVTTTKPRWCGRIYYKLHHRYHTPSARRRLQRTYQRYCS